MKLVNTVKKYGNKVAVGSGLVVASAMAAAADGSADIASIGTTAAVEIAKFAIMISAIGAAVLSVVVLIQGFRMAFGMVKTAR